MLDINTEEELVQLVGGKFRLTALIQKRMAELNRGAPPLVEFENNEEPDLRTIVIKEILEGKIELAPMEELDHALQEAITTEKPEEAEGSGGDGEGDEDGDGNEIYGSDIKKIKEQRIKELAQLLNQKK